MRKWQVNGNVKIIVMIKTLFSFKNLLDFTEKNGICVEVLIYKLG